MLEIGDGLHEADPPGPRLPSHHHHAPQLVELYISDLETQHLPGPQTPLITYMNQGAVLEGVAGGEQAGNLFLGQDFLGEFFLSRPNPDYSEERRGGIPGPTAVDPPEEGLDAPTEGGLALGAEMGVGVHPFGQLLFFQLLVRFSIRAQREHSHHISPYGPRGEAGKEHVLDVVF
ncbi:MAG: hypothetical protein QXW77_03030 [Candidatus Hadarchaeales archaeon]